MHFVEGGFLPHRVNRVFSLRRGHQSMQGRFAFGKALHIGNVTMPSQNISREDGYRFESDRSDFLNPLNIKSLHLIVSSLQDPRYGREQQFSIFNVITLFFRCKDKNKKN